MTKRLASLLVLVLALQLCVMAQPASAAEGLQVGVASATINPLEGTFLGGYGLDRRSTGVHDDLFAKAVVFYDGQEAVALVVLDSLSVQYDTTQAIRAAASAAVTKIPLAPERIIVQSTHAHCAPDTVGIYGPDQATTGRVPEYMERMVSTAAAQVARAVDALQPARLVHAGTECVGWAVNDSEPEILDNSVAVLQCLDAAGKSIATLTNFACHPTVLDGDTTQSSADWVASFYETMAALPGEHLYLQGAVGCWIQPKTPERTFGLAKLYGRDLGKKTLAALENATTITDVRIRFAHKTFGMPNENPAFTAMGEAGLVPRDFGDLIATEVAWFAIGPAQFATHLGETAPEFTTQTRALMNTGPKFVLGLGLDHLGYICPKRYFDDPSAIPHAEYLTRMSPGPAASGVMMEALAAIIP